MRVKEVQKAKQKNITFDYFEDMLNNGNTKSFDGERFSKAFKKTDIPSVRTVDVNKKINKKKWDVRKLDVENDKWIPLCEDEDEVKETLSDVEEENEIQDE